MGINIFKCSTALTKTDKICSNEGLIGLTAGSSEIDFTVCKDGGLLVELSPSITWKEDQRHTESIALEAADGMCYNTCTYWSFLAAYRKSLQAKVCKQKLKNLGTEVANFL